MSLLYNLLIQPLVLVYDILFTLAYGLIDNPVLSIVALSIVINFIVLPLYRKADALQKAEQEKAKKMKPWIDHIRKHFSGDERFMMQSTYYRIEHYSPISALKEAGPLFLQIPFFIAAYRYISTIPMLEGATFGPIRDLLKPDGLIVIAGFSVNVLPILMTVINIISGVIYSKGGPLRQKIQIYGTALIFLVLLYDSPSGLVIYWIMNNLFSLGKNIYDAWESDKKRFLPTIFFIVIAPFIVRGMFTGNIITVRDYFIAEIILSCGLVHIIVTILTLCHVPRPGIFRNGSQESGKTDRLSIASVLVPELALTLLLGFYIPSTVIASSPVEFRGVLRFELLSYTAVVYAGLLLIWTTVLVLARDGGKRRILIIILWCLLGVALVNQFLFPAKTGTLNTDLTFDGELKFPIWLHIVNVLSCAGASGILWFLYSKKRQLLVSVGGILSIALLGLSLVNYHTITQGTNPESSDQAEITDEFAPLTLSRTGKNVVVMMLDRAVGGFVPYIFDEIPELKDSYRGFVYYPNTVSFGNHTNFGSPGLFGGYEYTPYESNKRDTVSLKDKQNEALKLMPSLFSENGYQVTVCDPPYANYEWTSDLSIYDGMPNVSAYNLQGKFSSRFQGELKGNTLTTQKHNFVIYSLFRTAPLFMKVMIYDEGRYLSTNSNPGYTNELIGAYSVLAYMKDLTTIADNDQNQFLMFQNDTPHNPTVLNPPDYAVNDQAAGAKYEDRVLDGRTMKIRNQSQLGHYCINVATYKALARWLDYLKEQGVYDNTRIILVSDHGYYLRQFDDLVHPAGFDIESLNPLLMVKDFDADGEWTVDNSFMSNADVPVYAMRDVIEDPVNPFTGNPVNDDIKKNGPLVVTDSDNWKISVNNENTFDLGKGSWWTVHDSIFDVKNWERLKENAG